MSITDTSPEVEALQFDEPVDLTVRAENQWRAHALHMANWGGFEGITRIDLAADTTLITGSSGAGKSTLLDAWTALMMDHGVKFNGASNDAVTGRARGEDQRNLVSYLRGMLDAVTVDGTGEKVPQLLRGRGTATWGAVAMTFRNDHGEYFTALRAFYVPAAATRDHQVTRRLLTVHGPFGDLAVLEDAGRAGLPSRLLRAALPGAEVHANYKAFAAALSTTLGIGANGQAEKALQLLARVQAGHKVATVDGLYKSLVIEKPATYDAADAAIDHFNNLEDSYTSMVEDLAKVSLLDPVITQHDELTRRRAELAHLERLDGDGGADSPLAEWALRTEERLLDTAEAANSTHRRETANSIAETRGLLRRQADDLAAVEHDHRSHGGERLEALEEQISNLARQVEDTRRRRTAFDTNAAALDTPRAVRADFDALTVAARAALDTDAQTRTQLKQQREQVQERRWPALRERSTLRSELDSLRTRTGSVPARLDEIRQEVAHAAGIAVADLPFVAELVDLAPGQERWRRAVEETLYGVARTMLVPAELLEQFSARIDDLRLRGRLQFQGVTRVPHTDRRGEPGHVSGLLVFADSPYAAWVHQRITAASVDAETVEDAADLGGPGEQAYRVTPSGQTRRGRAGAHGQRGDRPIIGFSNTTAVADIEARIGELDADLEDTQKQLDVVENAEASHQEQMSAYRLVLATAWDDIDVDTLTAELGRRRTERDDLLASDSRLADLAKRIDRLSGQVEDTKKRLWGLEDKQEKLDAEQSRLVDRKDAVVDALDSIERRGVSGLTEDAAALIDAQFDDTLEPPATDQDVAGVVKRLRGRLRDRAGEAETAAAGLVRDIERTFGRYLEQWPDPNLSANVAAYPEFLEILEDLRRKGLYSWHDTWVRNISRWAASDLVPLHAAYTSAVETIQARLDPVNDILAKLPFGADADRLRIDMELRVPDSVARFRRRLKELSALATTDLTELSEEQVKDTFEQLRRFIAGLRDRRDDRAAKDARRDDLLDVRRHLTITARRYDPDTLEKKADYDALGGKSGGESQELVAFIVGAALRYQLGDELRSRPRFAPVLLDEGFVKSDSEFTGRSMAAWRELGFQLIVAAPLDKAASLEPYCDGFLQVTKLRGGYSRALPIPAGAQRTVSLAAALAEDEQPELVR